MQIPHCFHLKHCKQMFCGPQMREKYELIIQYGVINDVCQDDVIDIIFLCHVRNSRQARTIVVLEGSSSNHFTLPRCELLNVDWYSLLVTMETTGICIELFGSGSVQLCTEL